MTTYAMITKRSTGSGYQIRTCDRFDPRGYQITELYGDHYATRAQAEGVVQDRAQEGWIKVTSWKQARLANKVGA